MRMINANLFGSVGVGLWLLNIASRFELVKCDMYDHMYSIGDKVELWVNKVGPYANPQEAYDYYALPFCAPETDHHPSKSKDSIFNMLKTTHSLGEIIGGHTLRHSGHDLLFASSDESNILIEKCTTEHPLTIEEALQFGIAAQQSWFYQMYLDDLPIWGMVGEMLPEGAELENWEESTKDKNLAIVPYVYSERDLIISYNENRIVKVDLVSIPKSLKQVKVGETYTFKTYIQWLPTKEDFHSRFERYLDHTFFKHQIHWFSIFNSFMMILFLMGLVALILLRTLRKDFARYAVTDEDVDDLDEENTLLDKHSKESGWKQVHGDVFRSPSNLVLFSAVLGTGWQLISLTLGVILFALAGPLHGEVHEERGEILYAVLICYSLSSVIAGYASGSYYKDYQATISRKHTSSDNQWQLTMISTVMLLPTVVVSILSFLNCIAWWKVTVNYIPFFAILKLSALWILVSVPLCIVGTLLGRHAKVSDKNTFPCRVNAIPRPIPEDVPWFGVPEKIIPLAGLLSFGSIFIELYYVLTSFWNYKVYSVYGFLLGVYIILVLVVSLSTTIVVYFTLNAENYNWQWTALWSGASTSMFVFLYGLYFFLFRTNMFGFMQTCFYFGYTILMSLFLGTICGTIGYVASSRFVRLIFANVKLD
uniref:Transmembrane 9 superfamily member n=1 Tax=Eucampia antarctica TaxID=49252 RepID=A0A7S2SH80_9STRA|mmetsp:Transcript_7861/g.7448  ORF Transcript_7861/g.7448 Transcript_7861/m.7448 type:complete len:650 (+) Transcript_7861:103-2052(+)